MSLYRSIESYKSIINRWLGDGPRMVRDIFSKARENSPCIIFIDEVSLYMNSIIIRLMLLLQSVVILQVLVIVKFNVF